MSKRKKLLSLCLFSFFAFSPLSLALAQSQKEVPASLPTGYVDPSSGQTVSVPTPISVSTSQVRSSIKENPSALPGPKLIDAAQKIGAIYPGMVKIKEETFIPSERGASSFLGLVARLLGSFPNRDTEGLSSERYLYHVYGENVQLGVVHGTHIELRGENPLPSVFVYYDMGGKILDIQTENFPENTRAELKKTLDQYKGMSTFDFEVTIGKKGRIKSRGRAFTSAKRPSSSPAREYFERIHRSLRYNASFMDVAFFITQHPDLADIPVEDFPSQILTTGASETGPEAHARKMSGGNPLEGKPAEVQ